MTDFVLPSLGADMDEAMLVAWLVAPGDRVEYGQVIAEVETDKGVIEIECWQDAVVEELLRQPGPERLTVGTPLARLRVADEDERPVQTRPPAGPADERPSGPPAQPMPPVRHLAHTLGVEIESVEGTGPGGAVTRGDVERAATVTSVLPSGAEPVPTARVKATPRAKALAAELGVDLASLTSARVDGLIVAADLAAAPTEESMLEPGDKVAAMRRAITRSMSRSKREIPHYYLATRIDLKQALDWLERENDRLPIADRVLPAVLLLKATSLALREVPQLNGHWIEDHFVPSESVHLGVAISLREGGLVAPAIHDADTLALSELMARLRDVVSRARSWRLRSSEMSDPTMTVTNLGDRGVDTAFPVIIPPQVAMVAFGKIVDEVIAVDGVPAVHPVVHASLAADHRVTDGHTGGLLLTALDRLLQKPEDL